MCTDCGSRTSVTVLAQKIDALVNLKMAFAKGGNRISSAN